MIKLRFFLSALLLTLLPLTSRADLTIEIVGGAAQQIPIAVVPFAQAPGQEDIAGVISADLRRSGLFRVLETRGVAVQPHDISEVRYADWANLQAQALSETSQDESPSFAPNGRMLLYATSRGGKGTLAAVSVDGRVKQRLSETGGDVREPAWGPAVN